MSYIKLYHPITRKWHSESADPAKALDLSLAKQTNRQTKNFGHTEVRTLDDPGFSKMLLPTELWGRTYLITIIRLLLSDYYYQITIVRLTKNFGHTEVRTLDPRVFSTMLLPIEL